MSRATVSVNLHPTVVPQLLRQPNLHLRHLAASHQHPRHAEVPRGFVNSPEQVRRGVLDEVRQIARTVGSRLLVRQILPRIRPPAARRAHDRLAWAAQTTRNTSGRHPNVVTRRPAPSGRVAKVPIACESGPRTFAAMTPFGCALALPLLLARYWWVRHQGGCYGRRDPNNFLTRHLLNMVIGISLGWVVTRVDYRTLRAYTPMVYGVVITMLLVCAEPQGTNPSTVQKPDRCLLDLRFSPVEFAKIIVILAMAMVLSSEMGRDRPSDRDVRQTLIWAAAPVASSCPAGPRNGAHHRHGL